MGEKNNIIRYYCPLLGAVVETAKQDIIWKNSTGKVCDWSINIDIEEDVFDLNVTTESHIFFIGDPEDELKTKGNGGLLLRNSYKKLGYQTSWHTADDIFIKNATLHLSGVPVQENDLVWVRNDPLNSVHYYELLRQLCHVNARMLNSPESILTFHDKLSTMYVVKGSLYTAGSLDNVKRAYNHLTVQGYQEFIIKPPSRFGGKGIYKANSLKELLQYADKLMDDSGYVIIQGYIKTGAQQRDTRVVITQAGILGAVDRVAPIDSYICNISQDGHSEKNTGLTAWQIEKMSDIQKLMKKENIFIAGVDFLGDFITEINISCPSAFSSINKFQQGAIEDKIVLETLPLLKTCLEAGEISCGEHKAFR